MANISNQFISHTNLRFFDKILEDDISRIDKTLLNTQESEQSKIDKILDSIENFTFYQHKGVSFDTRGNYGPQIIGTGIDSSESPNSNVEFNDYYKALPIPTESEFEDTKDRLLTQMKDILKETYLNKGGDSKEFLHLYA
ncbi:hypothetical protein [Helicobacter mesocricetorum]|uniref:hypothetical protein n=1 Tax=Helicobacter mesocricetorum TaxID=87012 RepID=UPI000CF1B5AD|nr:hypothetical protein [Helicobacter mesocricetorum]